MRDGDGDSDGDDDLGGAADDELISRLRVIEGQPLVERAEAYAAVHDELARRLGGQQAGEPA